MSKYRSRKTTIDGITFASAREANRYAELKLLQTAGIVSQLEVQPRFQLLVNGVRICAYVADFRYFDTQTRCMVVEDVKGFKTPAYQLKKKLMAAIYGIKILET